MEVDKKETKPKDGAAAATDAKTDGAAKKEEKPVDPNKLAVADIDSNVTLVKKAVVQQESRFVQRVLRALVRLRKRLNPVVLNEAVNKHVPAGPRRDSLLKYLDGSAPAVVAMEVEPKPEDSTTASAAAATATDVPEVELYIHMLVAVFLIDGNKLDLAVQCVEQLIARVVETKRRSSDLLSARAYFFYARAHELKGTGSAIRGTLQAALRTATLRCDEAGQATIINLLLRNYLNDDLIGQADFLVSKTKFPENAANNENARYSYYLGRIKAVQLDYSEAKHRLEDATRKAAQGAVGFLQSAYKLLVIVQMLLGDIPERELFRRADLKNSLAPYLQLTQSVRVGDLRRFSEVVQLFGDKFRADKTYKLILRLRHNVIKTGIRMISLSYSRISLADISKKLSLESPEDAEFIVAKAIRDGVIDATIDHKQSFLQSKEVIDLYSTHEPQDVFHQRIAFCLKIHNDAVQAMRFPPNAYRKYLETPEQRRERELQESELAEEIEKEEKEDGSF